ncbi:MAG: hypothetical protein QXG10_00675 [Candidatus Hadarchaeales archaeon]
MIRRRDLKKAREWLDGFRASIQQWDDFKKGYALALNGLVAALNGGGEDSLVKMVLEGKSDINKIVRDINERLSLGFRPKDEQGFDRAWLDFLENLRKK